MTNQMISKSLLFPPIKIPSLFRPLLIFPFQFSMTCTVGFIRHTFLILKALELFTKAGKDSFGYSPASVPLPDYQGFIDEITLVLHEIAVGDHSSIAEYC